jgi:hypothetical protein
MKLHFATEKIWQTRAFFIAEVAKQHLLQNVKEPQNKLLKTGLRFVVNLHFFLKQLCSIKFLFKCVPFSEFR